MSNLKVIAIIPARGGSKGMPKKNIALCAGRSLIAWTVDAVHESVLIDQCIISSDDTEIIAVAKELGGNVPFVRPDELSQDDTPALPVIMHAVEWMEIHEGFKADIIVLLQPTSPLRTGRHIDEAVKLLVNDSAADSVVSVTEVPHQYSPASVMIQKGGYVVPWQPQDEKNNLRQLKPKFLARNGAAIYAFRRSCLIEKGSIYGDKILPYHMSYEDSVDIDRPFDLKICEMLLKERRDNKG